MSTIPIPMWIFEKFSVNHLVHFPNHMPMQVRQQQNKKLKPALSN